MANNFNLYVNRDENSFTARLFEGILFPQWRESNENEFNHFLKFLVKCTKKNKEIIKNNEKFSDSEITCWKNNDNINKFDSGMLFLELWDINYLWYSQNKELPGDISDEEKKLLEKPDKTELDSVILCKDKSSKQHLLVFEVKCYSNLDASEIKRQKKWMKLYSKLFDFEFHHFVIIAYDYLNKATEIFNEKYLGKMNDLFVLTWDDFFEKGYIKNEISFPNNCFNLHNEIRKDHTTSKRRNLINSNNLEENHG